MEAAGSGDGVEMDTDTGLNFLISDLIKYHFYQVGGPAMQTCL